jgi:flagellar biosynthesis component FlhA
MKKLQNRVLQSLMPYTEVSSWLNGLVGQEVEFSLTETEIQEMLKAQQPQLRQAYESLKTGQFPTSELHTLEEAAADKRLPSRLRSHLVTFLTEYHAKQQRKVPDAKARGIPQPVIESLLHFQVVSLTGEENVAVYALVQVQEPD